MKKKFLDFFNLKKKSSRSYGEYFGYIAIGVLLFSIGKFLTGLG